MAGLGGHPTTPGAAAPETAGSALERPWLRRWDHLPKLPARPGCSTAGYAEARRRAREVARATLGEELWAELQRLSYLDVPSRCLPS